jgi:hypothetical protein
VDLDVAVAMRRGVMPSASILSALRKSLHNPPRPGGPVEVRGFWVVYQSGASDAVGWVQGLASHK